MVPRSTGVSKGSSRTRLATGFSDRPVSHTRALQKLQKIVFQVLFLSEPDFRLVSSRRARYRLVSCSSTPAYSPRDKRGKEGAGNRMLGISIRADNGRFPPLGGPRRKTGQARTGEREIFNASRRAGRGKKDHPGGSRKACLFFGKKFWKNRKGEIV